MDDFGLEGRKRRLLYRSTHRGCKETDILLGAFAQRYLALLDEEELVQYEKIVELDDELLYSYIVGRRPVPDSIDKALVSRISACASGK
ncbi:succinate dehydrogenase assembly factor 2 [Anaplasma marginale]|nr:succinate dehydrogenase assembly factor 2 [Anaplasma marginale]AXW84580.1 succinate dehydrogenase assembly factor 2 [Anaplasma marginale]AXW85513.1 succinate dehydrogenase assembly factor 2 [Anaplasma marginale]KAA8472538.1 succinate dehydrogenase assembly factor 2 [Anaplasma marginale]KAA8474512.1 succinate dehydrogenase assembly factor 2 [Anaplasma marginale]KAB0450959.1 succinate dehydrogenase assembly factor 2 [Anaplasma marginale]